MVQETVRKLVQDEIEPVALDNDEHRRFARGAFDQLAGLGMLGLPIAEQSGGAGMGWLAFAVAIEELAGTCGSTARLLLSQAGLCGKALEGSSSCEAIAAGEQVGAFVGPEYRIVAEPDGDGHRLTGSATLVTAAMEADVLVVAAADASGQPMLFCFGADGVARQPVAALGFRATAPGSVELTSHEVAPGSLVARGADAEAALSRAKQAACLGGGAIAVGLAQASYELSRRYADERQAFGKRLSAQQAVRLKLVEALRKTQAARHMVYHAARLADLGEDAGIAAILAKLQAVAAAQLSADEAIQIHGGYGYVVEYHVERHYREATSLEVMDGVAESLRDELAQRL